jgi:hypothetical protein
MTHERKPICILGVDPGSVSGAMAFYFPDHPDLITAEDLPTMDGELDAAQVADRIRQMKPDFALVEKVGSMPKQGIASAFNFGFGCGQLNGVIAALGIPVHYVTPGKWKKHFRLNAEKEKSRAAAIRLWPTSDHFQRKKDHGRAEAALLARYGAEVILQEVGQ